jgi:hypothetical protein
MYLCARFKLCAFKTPPSAIPVRWVQAYENRIDG